MIEGLFCNNFELMCGNGNNSILPIRCVFTLHGCVVCAARLQTELKATILERNMAREEASILKKKLSTYKNYDGNHAQVDQAATSETEIKGPGKEAGDGSHVHNSEVEDARFASPQHLRSNRLAMSSQIDTESGDIPKISPQNKIGSALFAVFLCFWCHESTICEVA
jgi:hypothetical protein